MKSDAVYRLLAALVTAAAIFSAGGATAATPAGEGAGKPAAVDPLPASNTPIPENYNCITCHLDIEDELLTPPVKEWNESVHREVGVACADCHGGDPFDEDVAMDPDNGFLGKPEPKDIPGFCAKCHSNAKMMRKYNQRADQYDLYAGSVHGRKLLGGDEEAPTCVSCHGKHKVLRVKDPNATVFRANIPELCGGCHSKKEIFKKRRKPYNQLALYKQSWHYEQFTKGDLLVPTCVDCHSNHGVISPRSERVRTSCFNCHATQAEYYKSSPHWQSYQKEGEPLCLDCHNNHNVRRPSVEDFTGEADNDCIGCHEKTSRAYTVGREIQAVMTTTTAAVRSASEELEDFHNNARGGFEVTDFMETMEKAKENLKELNALTHKLDVKNVKKQAEDMIKTARGVSEKIDEMWAEIRKRKIGMAIAWAVFIGFAWTAWAKSKTLRGPE